MCFSFVNIVGNELRREYSNEPHELGFPAYGRFLLDFLFPSVELCLGVREVASGMERTEKRRGVNGHLRVTHE